MEVIFRETTGTILNSALLLLQLAEAEVVGGMPPLIQAASLEDLEEDERRTLGRTELELLGREITEGMDLALLIMPEAEAVEKEVLDQMLVREMEDQEELVLRLIQLGQQPLLPEYLEDTPEAEEVHRTQVRREPDNMVEVMVEPDQIIAEQRARQTPAEVRVVAGIRGPFPADRVS